MRQAIAVMGIEVVKPPELPVAQLLIGKSVDHAVELLPRIFNLCKTAQSLAVRMACGLPTDTTDTQVLHCDIIKEHQLRLGVLLPANLGLEPAQVAGVAADAVLDNLLATRPLLNEISARFAPFDAAVTPDFPENSVAARQAHLPVMRQAEKRFGRGPLWRILARFCEIGGAEIPMPARADGWISVPAARGTYKMRAGVVDGQITDFERQTPTDDMLRADGLLERTLGALRNRDNAALLVDVLDPCVPLELRRVQHA